MSAEGTELFEVHINSLTATDISGYVHPVMPYAPIPIIVHSVGRVTVLFLIRFCKLRITKWCCSAKTSYIKQTSSAVRKSVVPTKLGILSLKESKDVFSQLILCDLFLIKKIGFTFNPTYHMLWDDLKQKRIKLTDDSQHAAVVDEVGRFCSWHRKRSILLCP